MDYHNLNNNYSKFRDERNKTFIHTNIRKYYWGFDPKLVSVLSKDVIQTDISAAATSFLQMLLLGAKLPLAKMENTWTYDR